LSHSLNSLDVSAMGSVPRAVMERGHPCPPAGRSTLSLAVCSTRAGVRLFALRAQADRDVRAPLPLPVLTSLPMGKIWNRQWDLAWKHQNLSGGLDMTRNKLALFFALIL